MNKKQELIDFICSLSGIRLINQKVRIAFYGYKKLAQIEKTDKNEDFWVWVRKETKNKQYPNKDITKYKDDGGWDYPAFKICTEDDLEKAKQNILFAYENL